MKGRDKVDGLGLFISGIPFLEPETRSRRWSPFRRGWGRQLQVAKALRFPMAKSHDIQDQAGGHRQKRQNHQARRQDSGWQPGHQPGL